MCAQICVHTNFACARMCTCEGSGTNLVFLCLLYSRKVGGGIVAIDREVAR